MTHLSAAGSMGPSAKDERAHSVQFMGKRSQSKPLQPKFVSKSCEETPLLHMQTYSPYFNCLSVHVDNHTITIPTKCTSFLLLKAQDITICAFVFYS
jgi:hypothetical protein